jgi:hypothetical protein
MIESALSNALEGIDGTAGPQSTKVECMPRLVSY